MRILITGDMGKIGSATRHQLEEAGHEVKGYDIRRDCSQDILNPGTLLQAMENRDCVVHAAAIPHPRHGSFGKYFDINVHGTKFVVEAAASAGVKRLIYTSSTGYYGCDLDGTLAPLYFPIDEKHPHATCSGDLYDGSMESYNTSKVMAEQIVAYYGTNRVLETVALRFAPANAKSWQYRAGWDWREDQSWKRGCFFSNCHPNWCGQAIKLAVEAPGPFWYEAYNITDRYTPVDIYEFLRREYPHTPIRGTPGRHDSLISPHKAVRELGFQPCED